MDPKPRRRGRPRKPFDGDVSAEKRRERVRRAQNAFHSRKEADAISTGQRIKALGDIIERMSQEHNSLTDTLLESRAIRLDPSVVPRLQQSLQSFRDMARIAIKHEATGDDSASENPEVQGHILDNHGRANLQAIEFPFTQEGADLSSGIQATTRADDSALFILQKISQAKSSPLHHPTFFGDHWMTYGPWSVLPRVAPPNAASWSMARQACPFGLEVLRSVLNVAYYSLVDQYGNARALNNVARSFFRFAFLDFTPEELSFIIRWYLGPGNDELPCLGFATTVYDASYEVEGKPTIQSLPLARSYNKGGYYAPYPTYEEDYISLFDLDNFLRGLGVFEINSQTFSMLTTLPNPILQPSTSNVSNVSASSIFNSSATPQRPQNLFNFDHLFHQSASTISNFPSSASISPQISPEPPNVAPRKVFVISIAKFIQELSSITLCLCHGPAIIRRLVQPAVLASVIDIVVIDTSKV
ncbi:hypothetical protein K505DRAFT_421417 [Melanomma pulvis-pyrius CBS 109.77]|uniref:BZIP domain-containing protein n=1 Tax=Melanomma pulvis-pyrius CBS 109.77 TaxID=1314802 RepID=A0A6A6WVP0_9PLEO|nr:hypothetical protein K505DRAFT_421417 [Melanomma pulvis-pyrius CBS 109.77]